MRTLLILCVSLFLICLAGCSNKVNTKDRAPADYGELPSLSVDHATEDARKAIRTGDFRLLGMNGFATDLPGVPIDRGEDLRKIGSIYGVRILRGSTDTPADRQHEQLIDNAHQYAEKYNRTILAEHKVGILK